MIFIEFFFHLKYNKKIKFFTVLQNIYFFNKIIG